MIPLLRAMPRRVVAGAFSAGLVSISALVACAPDGITRPAPTGASFNVTPSQAAHLKVCTGDGPPGIYTYQIDNVTLGAGTLGTPVLPLGTTFNVPSGGCVDAVTLDFGTAPVQNDPRSDVTVTQIARPAGVSPSYVQWSQMLLGPEPICLAPDNFPCGQDKQVFSVTTSIALNRFHGSVLAFFHNSASLGDFVWSDTNGDGIQDAGEAGIPGLTITLSGTVSATTVTGPNGEYSFTGLPAGTYGVTVATPAGMTPSPVNAAGSTPSTDSNGSGTSVTLAAGESNPTIDVGFVPPRFVIGDRVWSDTNGDGVQDAGEPGLNGVTVTINGPDGYAATATTAGDGIYAFNNLLAGTYTVCTSAGVPSDATQTYDLDGLATPNCATVTVGPSTTAVDFGYKPARFSIGDRVWSDANGNGVQDAGETGLTGVTVTIAGPGGYSASTTTAADGIYGFSGLLAGTYTVCTTAGVPSDATQTYDLDGLATPNCATVTVGPSTTAVDFGYEPAHFSIGDRVWSDTNGNGVQDAGETGLIGVTVTIAGPGGYSATTTTAADGIYGFSGLLAGTYTVCTTAGVPSDATQTYDLDGLATPNCATVTVGPSTTAVDFGYKPARFSIGDRVWSDANGNGTQDAGEPGLTGVTVTIAGPGGYSASTTTVANGIYSFTGLVAGTYTVCTSAGIPAGYTETYDFDGTGTANCATVAVGPSTTAVDFGYTAPPPPPPTATCVVINAVAGSAIVPVTVTGSGGAGGPYTFTASGLPAGLTMSSAGVISGIPAVSGTFSYTVTVMDNSGRSGRINCAITVKAAPSASCVNIVAVQNVAMTPVTLVGTGGSGAPYTFSASFLPAALKISPAGTISGTPEVNGSFTYSVIVTDKDGHTGTLNCTVTVSPPSGTGFATYTQGGWGSNPHGNNPGQLLTTKFAVVYPSKTVVIGGTRTLTFTSAAAIINFLPQGSTPGTFAASATNPTTSAAGVFAGQVLALQLSVDFSAAGVTRSGLGAMRLASGKLAGRTVAAVLALANSVIGGNVAALPSGVTISDLNGIVDTINNNFDGGTTNNGYVIP